MREHLPLYYRKSKVINQIMDSLEAEYELLKQEVQLTENQFFVLLSDRSLSDHEKDVGIASEPSASEDTRRGRILSKFRGNGTVTKSMMKNVAASFVNGEIEIIEYASQYLFAVKFMSKQGVPYNLSDIQKVIEDIKPAHLAVEYVFTYRMWQEVKELLSNWQTVKSYSWESLMAFDSSVINKLYIENSLVYYRDAGGGNAFIYYENNKAYARRVNE